MNIVQHTRFHVSVNQLTVANIINIPCIYMIIMMIYTMYIHDIFCYMYVILLTYDNVDREPAVYPLQAFCYILVPVTLLFRYIIYLVYIYIYIFMVYFRYITGMFLVYAKYMIKYAAKLCNEFAVPAFQAAQPQIWTAK